MTACLGVRWAAPGRSIKRPVRGRSTRRPKIAEFRKYAEHREIWRHTRDCRWVRAERAIGRGYRNLPRTPGNTRHRPRSHLPAETAFGWPWRVHKTRGWEKT